MTMYADAGLEVGSHHPEALKIANEYVHYGVEPDAVTEQLSAFGSFGALLSGEIYVDAASVAPPENTDAYWDGAYTHLNTAVDLGKQEGSTQSFLNGLQARNRLAQLATSFSLWSDGTLPDAETAQDLYFDTLHIATDLEDASAMFETSLTTQQRINGISAEMAVLLLAQRFAIREIGPHSWFPFTSTLREDHGSSCIEDSFDRPVWDLNIFTRLSSDQRAARTYALQIKRSRFADMKQVADAPIEGETAKVRTVSLYPEVLTEGDERSAWQKLSARIIRACQWEMYQPAHASRITAELNRRTDKFLNRIG